MDVFLLYFSKFILSVWTFFYIYCFCQYEGELGFLVFFFWVPGEISCLFPLFPSASASSHFHHRKKTYFIAAAEHEACENIAKLFPAPARVKLISILHMPFITATDETHIFFLSYSAFIHLLFPFLLRFTKKSFCRKKIISFAR